MYAGVYGGGCRRRVGEGLGQGFSEAGVRGAAVTGASEEGPLAGALLGVRER